MLKIFVEWTKFKIRLHLKEELKVFFKEREIWWASLGVNVGFEQNGKNEKFERPVLVLRKFNKDIFWALPLTSKSKKGKYYYQFDWKDGKSSVILSQLKVVSSKRLVRKMGTLNNDDFKEIRERTRNLI